MQQSSRYRSLIFHYIVTINYLYVVKISPDQCHRHSIEVVFGISYYCYVVDFKLNF